jgi:predicted RNA-binding Zn ribbon-like protein
MQVLAARMRADTKNELLEKKLSEAEHEYLSRKSQVNEVLIAAKLDPAVLSMVHAKLDSVLETRNAMIRELQQGVSTLTKAHNDAVRVFEAKLRDMGIPGEEAIHSLLPSATGVGPAGLVAKPTIS